MMKPTEKQIKVIDSYLSIIKTWKNTNDITSPTHCVDIDEFTRSDLMDEIEDDLIFDIQDLLYDLWRIVNKVK